jgi:signal transduction histidine kinase
VVNSLSGRFLILTVIFVMLAEVFIFVPSVARFREDYLLARLERAQIASLALLATDGMIDDDLEYELLRNAEVLNVVLLRDATRQLILSSRHDDADRPQLRSARRDSMGLIRDAMRRLATPENETIRVIGQPVNDAGLLIEITLPSEPLRMALIDYGLRILALSLFISMVTAALLFIAVRYLLVVPDQARRRSHDLLCRGALTTPRASSSPRAACGSLRDAENALQSMQTQLTGALRQRERLAQLGEAVAKISHDLRNILSVTTLMADRLEGSADPAVQRATPKILASLTRAVNLTEATLAFGRAEEPSPKLERIRLADVAEDVVENERLTSDHATDEACITYTCEVPGDLVLRADPEQLHRVLSNLVRNARQAIAATGKPGEIRISGLERDGSWRIEVSDTGPGLPKKALDHLFQPFHGGARKGGTGLGLAIAAEIVRGHGGALELVESGPDGTTFAICLPAGLAA